MQKMLEGPPIVRDEAEAFSYFLDCSVLHRNRYGFSGRYFLGLEFEFLWLFDD